MDRKRPVLGGSVRFPQYLGWSWTGCGPRLPIFGAKNRTEPDLRTLSAPGKLISAQSMTRLEGRNLHHSPFIPLSFDCFTPLDDFGRRSADAGLLSCLSCFSRVDESTFCPGCEIPLTATVFVPQNEQVQMTGAIVEGGS